MDYYARRAKFFATLDIIPLDQREKMQELVRWFAEDDPDTAPMLPFLDRFHNVNSATNYPITILDFPCFRSVHGSMTMSSMLHC